MEVIKNDPEADFLWKDGFWCGVLAGVNMMGISCGLGFGLFFGWQSFIACGVGAIILNFMILWLAPDPQRSDRK